MEKKIYSKYSNNRKPEYQIRTDIFIDEKQQKYVCKSAFTEKANLHVGRMTESYEKLSEIFKLSKLSVVPCYKKGNTVWFDYIDGVTLEQKLYELIIGGALDEAIAEMQAYFNILEEAEGKQEFSQTEGFVEVFGNGEYKSDFSLPFSNLDFNFDNIILSKDEMFLIDYEWTYEFPIPIKYIRFRAVTNFIARYELHHIGFWKKLDFSEEEVLIYEEMDRRFYGYIMDEYEDVLNRKYLFPEHNVISMVDDINEMFYANIEEVRDDINGNEKLNQIKQILLNQKGHVEQLMKRERTLVGKTSNQENHITQLLESERRLLNKLEEIERSKHELENHISELQTISQQKAQVIEQQKERINELGTAGHILRQDLMNKDQQLIAKTHELEGARQEIAIIKSTKAYRIMRVMWRIRGAIVPPNSLRAKVCRKVLRGVRRPFRGRLETRRQWNSYPQLTMPTSDTPIVSIVIPVYNQFHYTCECLKSIYDNTKDIAYEIIIADDNSSDLTKKITKKFSGIKVVRNHTNLRFLLNCNNAAKHAKGKYVLFLNNDTQVKENWLSSLVDLIEGDDRIGMVGSKLVYPDGRLQEAGGILWKDGSAWNYGHGQDPSMPDFNYVKEVDYISGAAIMISTKLWNEIGGFDERFVPAYYEDTDLAFEVRKRGYQVVYQPLSEITHFEGVSNGVDTTGGQKKYQVDNAKKFYDKWKDVLTEAHFPNGENVLLARDRSVDKKTILVIDHYVPHHDKDAGGKCTYMYMKLFLKLGMKVVFIGDNFYPHQPYTQELEQMGIHVLYGNYYHDHIHEWLVENGNYFDYAYLNRPHISIKYIDILKEHSRAKIIYFGHDLHYLREYREYELTGNIEKQISSNQWKKKEFDLFNKADVIYVVGSFEQAILKEQIVGKPIRNIPVYFYDEIKADVPNNWSERKDIMFVGGFGHTPNADAVLWFAENVFPSIVQAYPDIIWYIIGSNPTQEVLELASDNIVVTGFVSDEELGRYYESCRIAVVPLRVGAGVKGKVIEATYNRIPLVTTPIGAEGLSLEEEAFIVTEPTEEMAQLIIELYNNYDRLEKLSGNCVNFVQNHFTSVTAQTVVSEDVFTD